MKYVTLKNTDLRVSNISMGTGSFGERIDKKSAFEILDRYCELGGNFIDTANAYCKWIPGAGNCAEQILGEWLKTAKTSDVVIATKGGHYDFAAPQVPRVREAEIRKDLEESLQTLHRDCIDLYWLHRDDPAVPAEEILTFLEKLREEGKIRYYGASNFTLARLQEFEKCAAENHMQGFCAVSNQWSLARKKSAYGVGDDSTTVAASEDEYKWHIQTGMPLIPYSSTASGLFDRLYQAGVIAKDGKVVEPTGEINLPKPLLDGFLNERNLLIYEELCKRHEEQGVSIFALSIAYLFSQPFQVIALSSVDVPEQVAGLVSASELTMDEAFVKKFGK